jgi:hypothetical protein
MTRDRRDHRAQSTVAAPGGAMVTGGARLHPRGSEEGE